MLRSPLLLSLSHTSESGGGVKEEVVWNLERGRGDFNARGEGVRCFFSPPPPPPPREKQQQRRRRQQQQHNQNPSFPPPPPSGKTSLFSATAVRRLFPLSLSLSLQIKSLSAAEARSSLSSSFCCPVFLLDLPLLFLPLFLFAQTYFLSFFPPSIHALLTRKLGRSFLSSLRFTKQPACSPKHPGSGIPHKSVLEKKYCKLGFPAKRRQERGMKKEILLKQVCEVGEFLP